MIALEVFFFILRLLSNIYYIKQHYFGNFITQTFLMTSITPIKKGALLLLLKSAKFMQWPIGPVRHVSASVV